MADKVTDQDDAAAQKAYEDALAAKADTPQKPAATAVKAEAEPAPVAEAEKPAAQPKVQVAEKTAAKKSPAIARKKAPAKKATAKKVPAKKAVASKKTVPKKTTATEKSTTKTPAAKRAAPPKKKDTIMATKTETKTTEFASEMASEMQNRLAGMYEKGTEMTGEMVTFQRANAEAMAEAGKILFTGMQDMTRTAVEEGRKAADQMSEDARLMAAAKSPTELVKLQGDIMRRSFDNVVATSSKNTEAWIKLTNDAFAPLTSRMSETVDKMNKLAA